MKILCKKVTEEDEIVVVVSNNLETHIKHNDIGISIDVYNHHTGEIIKEYQIWFEDNENML